MLGVLCLLVPSSTAPFDLRTDDPTSQIGGDEDCEPHPPIRIFQDTGPQGFVLDEDPTTGEPIYRPGSGVRSGNGTAEDPYVISGWCLPTPGGAEATVPATERTPDLHADEATRGSILIHGTSAHVVVRDNQIAPVEASTPEPAENGVSGPSWGVALQEASNVTVAENAISGHELGGVLVEDTTDARVADNEISEEPIAGIYLQSSPGAIVEGNLVESSGHIATFKGPVGGIVAFGSPDTVYRSNTIRENPTTALRVEYGSEHAIVRGNLIEANEKHGIHVFRSENVRIAHNTANANGVDGIQVDADSPSASIEANTVANSGSQGIRVIGSAQPHVVDNTVTNAGADALHLAGAPGATVEDNQLRQIQRAGIQLWGTPHAHLEDNTMDRGGVLLLGIEQPDYEHEIGPSNTVAGEPVRYLANASHTTISQPAAQVILANASHVEVAKQAIEDVVIGVQIAHGENVTVRDSVLVDNQWNGLRVDETTSLVVEDNEIAHNGRTGFQVRRSSNATVQHNTLHHNQRFGAYLYDTPHSTVADNHVHHNGLEDLANGADGIRVWLSENVRVEDNRVHDNLREGIRLGSSDDNMVQHNTVRDNGGHGILAAGSDPVTIQANVVENSTEHGIRVATADDALLRDNNLVDNDVGVSEWRAEGLDARENWWGCSNGPNATACDGTEGDVETDPWLTSPSADAGVR